MKKRIIAILLCGVLYLTGCGSFLDREYSSIQPHSSSYYESEDQSVLRAEGYQDLVNDLLVLVGNHAAEGTIWLYAAGEEPDADASIEKACRELQQETPMGSYAVEYVTYTIDEDSRNYSEIQLTIGYRRTAEQVADMVHATSISALGDLLSAAAESGRSELVMQVGYFEQQEQEVYEIVSQVAAEQELSQIEVNFYPETGNVGIIEVLLES